jgi:U3 small nucleolar RNA-associated protein 23
VLVDSAILQETWQKKIDLVGRLKGVLGGEVKPMVTQCDMRHLYDAKPKDEQLILQAKTYERRRCGHHELEKPLSSLECLSSCVDPKGTLTNKHRYVVATQDPKIRAFMRRIPGVPLIYISKSVMILEPMASATEDVREREERAKFKAGLKGRRGGPDAGEKRKRDNDDEGAREQEGTSAEQPSGEARPQKKKRVKGPKGPNPLSVRKPKKPKDQPPSGAQKGEPAKSKSAKSEQAEHDGDDTAVHSGGEGGEPGKRKRKRKHKPKGEGGVSLEAQPEPTETAVS